MNQESPESSPFRILHLLSSERWTGAAEPVVSLARWQEELGHETWLACTRGKSLELRARMFGVRVVTNLALDRRATLGHLGDILALRRFIRNNRIDIVHCHLINDHWLAAMALKKEKNPPILVRTFHKLEAPRADRLHRWLFSKRTDCVIVPSRHMYRIVNKNLPLDNERMHVVLGAINAKRFHPAISGERVRRELEIEKNAAVAGMVARMVPGRGHEWLLQSLPAVYRALPDARTILVGRGPLKYTLRGRVANAPHAGRTLWGGYRIEDLQELYAAFNVACFLGQGSEGSNRSVLEAMAAGKPVIAVNTGAAPEYVEHGRTGLLVEPDDVKGLSDALIEMLSDLDRAAEMGRQARAVVEERFLEAHRAQNTLDVYRQHTQPGLRAPVQNNPLQI